MKEAAYRITSPHNIDAEQSVLGGILLCRGIPPDIEIRAGWFYRAAHRTILNVMLELDGQGQEIDAVTLPHALKAKNKLEEVGGFSYIADLADRTPSMSAESLANYARIIKEKAARRATISLLKDALEQVADEERPIEEALAQISLNLANIESSGTDHHFKDMRTLAKEGIKRMEARAKHPSHVSGIPTPFKRLNQLINGLQPSDLIVLAGRPSMGKSAIAQQIGEHVAQAVGPVAFFSLEMDSDSLADRSFASRARIPSQIIRSGHLQEADWPRLVAAGAEMSKLPIILNDSPSLTARQIRLLVRQARTKMGNLSLVIVDYLGLIRTPGTGRHRYLEVGEITRTLKQLGREMKVPVLLLSQLNRSCEARENKRPLLSDLRESGDVEQDSDVVMFIYRDEYYCPHCSKGKRDECTKAHAGLAEVNIAKHRKGPTGTVTLVWQGQYTRFEDRAVD